MHVAVNTEATRKYLLHTSLNSFLRLVILLQPLLELLECVALALEEQE